MMTRICVAIWTVSLIGCTSVPSLQESSPSGSVALHPDWSTHHYTSTGHEIEGLFTEIWFPKDVPMAAGSSSLWFEVYRDVPNIGQAEIWVPREWSDDVTGEDWMSRLEELTEVLGSDSPIAEVMTLSSSAQSALVFAKSADRVTVRLEDWAFPTSAPIFIALKSPEGDLVDGLLFGPPYEDSNRVHADLLSIRLQAQ